MSDGIISMPARDAAWAFAVRQCARPGAELRASCLYKVRRLSEGAEFEVQLGAGDEEIVVAAAHRGRVDRDGRAADRSEGPNRTIEIVVVLVEPEPQPLDAEGHRRRVEPVH